MIGPDLWGGSSYRCVSSLLGAKLGAPARDSSDVADVCLRDLFVALDPPTHYGLAGCLRMSGTTARQRPQISMSVEFSWSRGSSLFATIHRCLPRVAVTVADTRVELWVYGV